MGEVLTIPLVELPKNVSIDQDFVNRHAGSGPPYRDLVSGDRVRVGQRRLDDMIRAGDLKGVPPPAALFLTASNGPDDRALRQLPDSQLVWVMRYILTALAMPKEQLAHRETLPVAERLSRLRKLAVSLEPVRREPGDAAMKSIAQRGGGWNESITLSMQMKVSLGVELDMPKVKDDHVVQAHWRLTVTTSTSTRHYRLTDEQVEGTVPYPLQRVFVDYARPLFTCLFGLTAADHEHIAAEIERHEFMYSDEEE